MGVALRRSQLVTIAAVAAGLYACVAMVASKVRSRTGPLGVDAKGMRYLGRPAVTGHLARYHLGRLDGPDLLHSLVWFGSLWGMASAVVLLTLAALVLRDRFVAAVALVGPLAAEVLTEYVLKPLVDRTGPSGSNYFPSGHATGVAAVAVVAFLIVDRHAGRRRALGVIPVLAAWVAGVSTALVQLDYHYLTDVVGGIGVGTATVLTVVALVGLSASESGRERRPPALR